jgi:hypothetical protein
VIGLSFPPTLLVGAAAGQQSQRVLPLRPSYSQLVERDGIEPAEQLKSARPDTIIFRKASPRTCAARGSRRAISSATVDFPAAIAPVMTMMAGSCSTQGTIAHPLVGP